MRIWHETLGNCDGKRSPRQREAQRSAGRQCQADAGETGPQLDRGGVLLAVVEAGRGYCGEAVPGRVDAVLPGRAEAVAQAGLAQQAGEALEAEATHGQALVDPGTADQQEEALQADVAADHGAHGPEMERVLVQGVLDHVAVPAEALGPALVALATGETAAEILGLDHQDAVGQADQMVDLGPALSVRMREEHVVPRLEPVTAQEPGHPPLAHEATQPASLRAPRCQGERQAEDEQQVVEVAQLGPFKRGQGRGCPVQHGL